MRVSVKSVGKYLFNKGKRVGKSEGNNSIFFVNFKVYQIEIVQLQRVCVLLSNKS